MSEMLVIMLVFSGLGDLLQAPPRDLASLIEPKAALTAMEVATDEDSLIKLIKTDKKAGPSKADLLKAINELSAGDFKTRRAAKKLLQEHGLKVKDTLSKVAAEATDPEKKMNAQEILKTIEQNRRATLMQGDQGYAKKLLAIQLLGSMKSTKAVPALKAISEGNVPTLADAAAGALATITGKPDPRPNAKPALLDVASRLPANSGFVAMLDFSTGARMTTATALMNTIKEKPGMKDMVPPQKLEAMMAQAPAGIGKVLSMVGNVRLDAVAAIFPDRLGLTQNDSYAAIVFKGLYEPDKVEELLKMNMRRNAKVQGRTVYYSHEMGMCCWDATTFILVPCDRNDGRAIDDFLEDYAAKKKDASVESLTKVHPMILPGLIPVLNGKARISVGGALSADQRAMAGREIDQEIARFQRRNRQGPEVALQKAAVAMAKELIATPTFTGQVGTDGKITISGKATDKQAATKLKDSLDAFDKALVDMMTEAKKKINDEPIVTKMLDGLIEKKGLFLAKAADVTVSVQNSVDNLIAFPMLLFINVKEARAEAVQRMNAPRQMAVPAR